MSKLRLGLYLFLITLYHASYGQHKIYVNEWVNPPAKNSLEKPLVFVDFWATWCAPCISSMSHTEGLEQAFRDKILFLYVTEEPSTRVEAFMHRLQKHFISVTDTAGLSAKAFGVRKLPSSFLLDPRGKIIWQGKPSEITKSRLASFLSRYENRKGNPGRIVILRAHKTSSAPGWNNFYFDGKKLHYRTGKDLQEEMITQGDQTLISGGVKFVLSQLENIPPSDIQEKNGTEQLKIALKCPVPDREFCRLAFRRLLKQKWDITVRDTIRNETVYMLRDTSEANFFSSEIYDFKKGDAAYLSDDYSVTIDNADIGQMARILTGISSLHFEYAGNNTKKYDWSLTYQNPQDLLIQLITELGFVVIKKRETRKILVIEKKG